MKQIETILFSLFFLAACHGPTKNEDYSKTIKEQAETMGQFLFNKDFSSFCDHIYPVVIQMIRGKQTMIEILEKESEEWRSEGIELRKVIFDKPTEIIAIEKELQCTLLQTLVMKVPNGLMITKSTLIAISTDNGKNWYFIDTLGKDIQTMKKDLPNLSEELVIPESIEPAFFPD